MPELYQACFTDGSVLHFPSMKKLQEHLDTIVDEKMPRDTLSKVSFTDAEGTRIRMVYDPVTSAFWVTFWKDEKYEDF